ncbi:TetR family transcriptional regulator [Tamaricihabitans halophyticus]|uniref:TetR family transcriptional regulator n=1 Tax=Tamaricihabitans halophyticus TaxID=1262583 RepID=A0A4R2QHK6_9PSEU|nr:TetR/AcrR family transcriptional regulator [Tamaricihabitans halophyticus]TCP48657.1 TetR family transcriptional regulator [Tamaricihabitans halophyticus]
MGHREDLLAGAKRCLYERGYAHTTARDIVAASGTNLASIGYHFGSKDALLVEALLEAFDEWNAKIGEIAFAADLSAPDIYAQLEQAWTRIFELFAEQRPLMVANVEAMAQAAHSPQVREALAESYRSVRETFGARFAESLGGLVDERTAKALIGYQTALGDGMMLQWLFDPEGGPSATDIALATRAIVGIYAGQLGSRAE